MIARKQQVYLTEALCGDSGEIWMIKHGRRNYAVDGKLCLWREMCVPFWPVFLGSMTSDADRFSIPPVAYHLHGNSGVFRVWCSGTGIDHWMNSTSLSMTTILCNKNAASDRNGYSVKGTNLLSVRKVRSGGVVGQTWIKIGHELVNQIKYSGRGFFREKEGSNLHMGMLL